jgi:N-acetylglucosamine-6-sulfatase
VIVRRIFVLLAVLAMVAAAGAAPPPGGHMAAAAAAGKPDIIVFLLDDARADDFAYMPIAQSQLAAKGTTFTNGYVVNPLCCPSRASILTGQYSHSTDIYDNGGVQGGFKTFKTLGKDRSTVATWLAAAGYRTALIGKYMNGYNLGKVPYVPPGWNTWRGMAIGNNENLGGYYDYTLSVDGTAQTYGSAETDYSTDVFADIATNIITTTPANQPLFLYMGMRPPHTPSTPALRHATSCKTATPLRTPSFNEADISDKPKWVPRQLLDSADILQMDRRHKRHCQSLQAADEALRDVLDALQATGRLSNAMIILLSDNGVGLGEHRWETKKDPYEGSLKMPFVVRYDPITGGIARQVPALALNIDIAPTAAALAGVAAPGAEGRSLVAALTGTPADWRQDFLAEHWEPTTSGGYIHPWCQVHTERYKYTRYATGEEELYDLQTDPYELTSKHADPAYAALKQALRSRLVQLCSPLPPDYAPFS